jgi:hypothetical protein
MQETLKKGTIPNGNRYGLYVYNLREPMGKHRARRERKKANTEKEEKKERELMTYK